MIHPDTSIILTNGDHIAARHLSVGHTVFGTDGKPCVITAIEETPSMPVMLVGFSDGPSVFCGDRRIREQQSWPICKPVQLPKWNKPLHIHPYLLGFLLGDGCYSGDSTVTVSKGDDLIEHLAPYLPAGCSIKHINGPDYAIKGNGKYNECLVSLRRYGLMGHKSDTKFVPPRYLYGNVLTRLQVLAGLIDSDGTATKSGHLEFTTGSEQLAEDCAFLVRSLGGLIHMTTRITVTGKTGWRMPIWLPKGANPLKLPRKRERRALYKAKELTRTVKTVEKVEEGSCYRVVRCDNGNDTILNGDCVPVGGDICVLYG